MKKARTCFNCGDSEHFVAECPFKSSIENGGRLIKKNNFIPKTKSFIKKVASRALIAKEGEYISGGEESEDDEQQVGMASVAIGVTSSSQGSLFTNPNDKTSPTKHKCFMAKGVPPKVTSTPKIAISSTPSLLDCAEKVEDKNANQVHLSNLMDHKIAFDGLMNKLGEANGLIDEQDDKILELCGDQSTPLHV